FGTGLVWQILNGASTISWVAGWFHSTASATTSQEVRSAAMSYGAIASSLLFIAGLAWLSAIVFVPVLRPNIHAKILRGTFITRHPYDQLTRSAYKAMNRSLGPTSHDFLMRIFVVNK